MEKQDNPKPTTFDSVFRTMAQKMPWMMVALVNEVFGERYPGGAEVTQLRNEFMTKGGKIITDSVFLIGGKYYHIECQGSPDSTMEIRMIEYDFMIAHGHAGKENGQYHVRFPESAVLYLRHNRNTPDRLRVVVDLPGGKSAEYYTRVIKAQDYTKDEIFRKKLLILVPFYLMRYEGAFGEMDTDSRKRSAFLRECEDLRLRVEKEAGGDGSLYADLISLIMRVSDHILKGHTQTRKGVRETMGGKVLELSSEKLIKQGRAEGREEGMDRLSKLIRHLAEQGQTEEIVKVTEDRGYRDQMFKALNL